MSISAILFDGNGVLYSRPLIGMALEHLMGQYELTPRHPKIVHNYIRAAAFDACIGRITLNEYYNALLRIHGFNDEQGMAAGREALRFDASRFEINPEADPVLRMLQASGVRLGVIVNSPYSAEEEISWLERAGLGADLWAVYVSSSDRGALAPDPEIMRPALQALRVPPDEILVVSAEESILSYAYDSGLIAVAFANQMAASVHGAIEQLSQLPYWVMV